MMEHSTKLSSPRSRKLQGGQRFVVTDEVKVAPVVFNGVRAELPPRPVSGGRRRTSLAGSSSTTSSMPSDARRPCSAGMRSPAPFVGASSAGVTHALQGTSASGADGGVDPDKLQRPVSARPRLQRAPICFALPPAKHGRDDWENGSEDGEVEEGSLEGALRRNLPPPPPPPAPPPFVPQAAGAQDLPGAGQAEKQTHDKCATPLARRTGARLAHVQPKRQGLASNAAGRRTTNTDRGQMAPYVRKDEDFSTYTSCGGGVELLTALEPRSPNGPLDPGAPSMDEVPREGDGSDARQQALRKYGDAVKDIAFGDVQRVVRGPLHIPMRPRSAVGVRDGVFFELKGRVGARTSSRSSAARSPPQQGRSSLQEPRQTLGWGQGSHFAGGAKCSARAQRPVSAGTRYGGGTTAHARCWGWQGPSVR